MMFPVCRRLHWTIPHFTTCHCLPVHRSIAFSIPLFVSFSMVSRVEEGRESDQRTASVVMAASAVSFTLKTNTTQDKRGVLSVWSCGSLGRNSVLPLLVNYRSVKEEKSDGSRNEGFTVPAHKLQVQVLPVREHASAPTASFPLFSRRAPLSFRSSSCYSPDALA